MSWSVSASAVWPRSTAAATSSSGSEAPSRKEKAEWQWSSVYDTNICSHTGRADHEHPALTPRTPQAVAALAPRAAGLALGRRDQARALDRVLVPAAEADAGVQPAVRPAVARVERVDAHPRQARRVEPAAQAVRDRDRRPEAQPGVAQRAHEGARGGEVRGIGEVEHALGLHDAAARAAAGRCARHGARSGPGSRTPRLQPAAPRRR